MLLMLRWDLQIIVGSEPLRDLNIKSHEIKKNSVVTGIEPTTSGLFDQRLSRSDNQAPMPHAGFQITLPFEIDKAAVTPAVAIRLINSPLICTAIKKIQDKILVKNQGIRVPSFINIA